MKWDKKIVMDYIRITIGVTLLAIAITMFFVPNSMVVGGVTGLAIVIESVTDRMGFAIPIWASNLVINIPLFVIGARMKGLKFLAKTLYATLYLSVALYLAEYLPPIQADMILIAIFGGVLDGIGIGLVFRSFASTGGSDLAASIIQRYYPHLPVQKIMFGIDGVIIALAVVVFDVSKVLYALIAIFVCIKSIDFILEGLAFAKAVWIISDRSEQISNAVMKALMRGVTALHGTGMYTGTPKNVIMCVVSSKQLPQVKMLVQEIDQKAFLIVADVREVLGEGFKEVG